MTNLNEPDPLIKKLVVGIGEVSDITSVPTRKIRYWEEKGVITSVEDAEGATRRFDFWNIKKIIFIQELIEEGFTLDAAAKKVEVRMKNMSQAFDKLANSSNNNESK
ncbi:MerR family transcriptional regulator [Oceanobacillus sp. CF4.6]|uniref:MerR family transcriptional regulator n=1 Tax=Oceanobacillus sp. CF4.6 TaxID=3373080 RepID=UPI003EE5E015